MGEWAGNEVGLIAEVDCTADENTPICGGVQGYPTLKYGDPNSLQDYQGGRDYDELAASAKEHLKPVCSPLQLENCPDEEKAEIAKYSELSVEELEKRIADVEDAMAKSEQEFEAEVDNLMKEVELKNEEIQKEAGFKYLKSVLASKGGSSEQPPAEAEDEGSEL